MFKFKKTAYSILKEYSSDGLGSGYDYWRTTPPDDGDEDVDYDTTLSKGYAIRSINSWFDNEGEEALVPLPYEAYVIQWSDGTYDEEEDCYNETRKFSSFPFDRKQVWYKKEDAEAAMADLKAKHPNADVKVVEMFSRDYTGDIWISREDLDNGRADELWEDYFEELRHS